MLYQRCSIWERHSFPALMRNDTSVNIRGQTSVVMDRQHFVWSQYLFVCYVKWLFMHINKISNVKSLTISPFLTVLLCQDIFCQLVFLLGESTVAHKCHDKTYFLTAKLTFSRKENSFSQQNLLSHRKTYFLMAKLSFSPQSFATSR